MAASSIGGVKLPHDPSSVSWTYRLKTKVVHSVGGKIVQVFGVTLGNMTLSGSYSKGRFDEQETFVGKITDLAEKQADQVPHRLLIPARDWDFKVFIIGMSNPQGQSAATVDEQVTVPQWVLEVMIVEENAGLKKIASDQYISRLSEGIGWKPNEYNSNPVGSKFSGEMYPFGIKPLDGGGGAAEGGGQAGAFENLGSGLAGSVAPGTVDVNRILATIRQLESSNNYTAKNPNSSASGAYQFISSTWGGYGGYATAASAPPHVQDQRARQDVEMFLRKYNGILEAVPASWYTGSYRGPGKLNYNPGGPNSLTVQQYVDKWLKIYYGG